MTEKASTLVEKKLEEAIVLEQEAQSLTGSERDAKIEEANKKLDLAIRAEAIANRRKGEA